MFEVFQIPLNWAVQSSDRGMSRKPMTSLVEPPGKALSFESGCLSLRSGYYDLRGYAK